MRRRDDDLSPFRDEPVFQALTGPATDAELSGEDAALAAFRDATAASPRRRRSAARLATGSTVAVLTLGLSGGVAAAYTASLPASWQQKLHDDVSPLHFPAPKKAHPKPTPVVAAPGPSSIPLPTTVATGGTPQALGSPSAAVGSATPTSTATPTLPVVLPTPSVSPAPFGTPTPTPTPSHPGLYDGATLAITVSAPKVTVGGSVTVTGRLDAADQTPIAGRRVGLRYRFAGVPGWTSLDPQTTASDGSVTFTVSDVQRNLRLLLHSGRHVHSTVARVAIVPIITVHVPPPAPSAQTTTITVTVTGAQPGDLITVRRPGGRKGSQTDTLDGSVSASFTVPVSRRGVIHYRVFVARTKAHAAHSLPFYVPASGTTAGDSEPAA